MWIQVLSWEKLGKFSYIDNAILTPLEVNFYAYNCVFRGSTWKLLVSP